MGSLVTKCALCNGPVSSFCRQCEVSLCDPCVTVHLRIVSTNGHDIVDFAKKDKNDSCFCDSHPKHECSAYCKTCDLPICLLCISIKHKSHEISELSEKIEDLLKSITRENERLQSSRHKLKTVLSHITEQLSSLPWFYEQTVNRVNVHRTKWHKKIDRTVYTLFDELRKIKKENEVVLQKQKQQFEEMLSKMDEMNSKSVQLLKSKNMAEMQKFKSMIEKERTMEEFTEHSFPVFHECKTKIESLMKSNFGVFEKMKEEKLSLLDKNCEHNIVSDRKMVMISLVSSVVDVRIRGREYHNYCLSAIAVTYDKKVWVAGYSNELKLFDLQGKLHRIVTLEMKTPIMNICMFNKQVVFSDHSSKTVQKVSDDDTVLTMFKTGDWEPYGITGSSSGDFLVCLCNDDQSKVVRYSITGTVLQEIQYDSQSHPLYQDAKCIDENVNGDIIVSDFKKKAIIVVDGKGIFRYSYAVKTYVLSVATDSVGQIFVTDCNGGKIHILDRDGRFLGYIIPEGGINRPRAVCMIGDGELIVGECRTGLAKIIKFLDK